MDYNGECVEYPCPKTSELFEREANSQGLSEKPHYPDYQNSKYRIVRLKDCSSKKEEAASWFHEKRGVPVSFYLESMVALLTGDKIQEWYLCLDGEKIIAGMGEILNDFMIDRSLLPIFVQHIQKNNVDRYCRKAP